MPDSKPGRRGDNIEVRYHLNVGVRSVKRAYLLTYLLGGAFPDYSSLLGDIAALYKNAEYTSDGGTCTVSIGGTQAAELLKALCPALSVAGTIEGTAFEVSAVIDGITRSADHNIPEKVSLAASKLEADFAYGTVSLTVDGGGITGLSVRCTGTMQVVLVETEVSVSAAVAIQNGSAPQFPDKAVSALTQADG